VDEKMGGRYDFCLSSKMALATLAALLGIAQHFIFNQKSIFNFNRPFTIAE
jgi:hypothetical protein